MAGDCTDAWPPSTSLDQAEEFAASPVTKQFTEAWQLPGCSETPSDEVDCGSPRCHSPVVAVFAPAVLFQPRAASKSSLKTTDGAEGWNNAVNVVSSVGVVISCVA